MGGRRVLTGIGPFFHRLRILYHGTKRNQAFKHRQWSAHSLCSGSLGSIRSRTGQVFKLLSDETRLRILFYLALSPDGELHVTDLCNRLGQSQPAVSHHLALLRVSGLIESRREGKHNFYCVAHRSLR